jgi:predicted signal transduction protein with EAL and GGDEF domain
VYPADGADADTLLKHADLALFRAKSGGRSNHQFFNSSMQTHMGERAS